MLGQLLAYDTDGHVIASLDYLVKRDADGNVLGLHDFGAEEENGHEFDSATNSEGIWHVEGARGCKVWPQWLKEPHEYTVEKEGKRGKKKIGALVHRPTGQRIPRSDVDGAINERIEAARHSLQPVDLRDLVGGPDRGLSAEKAMDVYARRK